MENYEEFKQREDLLQSWIVRNNIKYLDAKKLSDINTGNGSIPITNFGLNQKDIDKFNELINILKMFSEKPNIVWNPSGSASVAKSNMTGGPRWDVINEKGGSSDIWVLRLHCSFRIRLHEHDNLEVENVKQINGYQAFRTFTKLCQKFGITLEDYALPYTPCVLDDETYDWVPFDYSYIAAKGEVKMINDGVEENRLTSSYKIELLGEKDKVYENVHHIDLHSAFPSNLIKAYPEFTEVFTYIYNRRKEDPMMKAIMNYSIGMMHSSLIDYKYSHLSRAAINGCNQVIARLLKELRDSGRTPIAINTDGIWYQGEIYHSSEEGPNLGQWANDHINCKIRFKSAGSYEYIEDGVYHPVVRGATVLDRQGIKREDWTWGSIYQGGGKTISHRMTTTYEMVMEEIEQ